MLGIECETASLGSVMTLSFGLSGLLSSDLASEELDSFEDLRLKIGFLCTGEVALYFETTGDRPLGVDSSLDDGRI